MEIFFYFMIGLFTASLGAVSPGTVNLTVAYITIRRGITKAYPIIIAGGIDELLICFVALSWAPIVQNLITESLNLQIGLSLVLVFIGTLLFLKRPKGEQVSHYRDGKLTLLIKGLILALANPPVIIFWLAAFAFLKVNLIVDFSWPQSTIIFLMGVFFGKIIVLLGYARVTRIFSNSPKGLLLINRFIGIFLTLLGAFKIATLM
jgi:threonine/homoserine/homoserine lactone efflux protein